MTLPGGGGVVDEMSQQLESTQSAHVSVELRTQNQRLEVQGPSLDTDLPFEQLGDWADEASDGLDLALRSGFSANGSGNQWRRSAGATRHAVARLCTMLRRQARRAQMLCMWVLHLLTCNSLVYFAENLSPRNVIFLAMSALVFLTAWISLEPGACGWALGVLYLLAASSRIGAVEPLWTAAAALALQCTFDAAPTGLQPALWWILGIVAAASELCWWPSAEFLIEANFHAWLVLFSTYYVVVIDFWFWPQLLQLDPSRWHITQEIEKAPEETREAIVDASAGLAVLVLLPLMAFSLLAAILIWRRNPRICIAVCAVYMSLVAVLVLWNSPTPQQVIAIGQVPIAVIFVVLAREQLLNTFEDTRSWKAQAVLLAALVALRHAAAIGATPQAVDQGQAVALLVFQLVCKQCLAAQCSAVRQGLPGTFRVAAWGPRRTGLLFGREDAHEPSLALAR